MKKKVKSFFLKAIAFKLRKKKIDINKTKKVLFMTYDAIGDMVMTTPLLREFKTAYPHIMIGVLASERNYNVLKHNPYIDKLYYFNRKKQFKRWHEFEQLKAIRKENYDVVVDIWQKLSSNLLFLYRMLGGKVRVGLRKVQEDERNKGIKSEELRIYDYIVEKPENVHFSEGFVELLKFFNIKSKSNKMEFYYGEEDRAKADEFLKNEKYKYKIALNPHGSIVPRHLKHENIKTIMKGIVDKNSDAAVYLLYTPNCYEEMKKIIDEIGNERAKLCFATQSILEVGAFLDRMDVVVSVDTAAVHIASALNKKQIGIFRDLPENYTLFRPLSDKQISLFSKSNLWVSEIDNNEVIEGVFKLL